MSLSKDNTSRLVIFMLTFILFVSTYYAGEGKKYEDFKLFDYNKVEHNLSDFTKKKGIVLIFVATRCPVSNAYNSRMESLYQKYKKDFEFVGINSNKAEDIEEIKEHAKENNLNFVILKDVNNLIADKFEASFTPEVYVLNNDFEQLYHGRIDDSRREKDVKEKDLDRTLTEIKEGKKVSINNTKAFGCTIKRVSK